MHDRPSADRTTTSDDPPHGKAGDKPSTDWIGTSDDTGGRPDATRDSRWMSYSELGEALGIKPASARRLSFRRRWPRRIGNDGTSRVAVPVSALVTSRVADPTPLETEKTEAKGLSGDAISGVMPQSPADTSGITGGVTPQSPATTSDISSSVTGLELAIDGLREQLERVSVEKAQLFSALLERDERIAKMQAEHGEQIADLQSRLTRWARWRWRRAQAKRRSQREGQGALKQES
ncbi:MAG: hypothetical protein JO189_18875 [Deltaproteobacteria bacterium]|nr:hypothetical protein [Deltaproteobacteria bacterium]